MAEVAGRTSGTVGSTQRGSMPSQASLPTSETLLPIPESLADLLPDAFRTWVNTGTITGISPDGRILVGWGAALGGFRGYIVILGSSRVMPS